ncbi:hypothetical protein CN918_28130 [Priestia megaterium]|nr:hypothetical protein CN918_28130 [Priestia megaterium]
MERFKIKFASSSLLALLFALILGILAISDRAVFRYEMFHPYFYLVFYPYAIGSSYLIDLICRDGFKKLLGYIFMGAIPFFIYFGVDTDMGLIVGVYTAPVGVVCALVYYFFTTLVQDSRILKNVIGWIIPLLLVTMTFSHFSFPAKKGFHEYYTSHGYHASFDELTGAVKVKVPVEWREEITLSIRVDDNEMGGYGYHIEDKSGSYVLTDSENDDKMRFKGGSSGPYYFVYQGEHLKGSIKVNWDIKELKNH